MAQRCLSFVTILYATWLTNVPGARLHTRSLDPAGGAETRELIMFEEPVVTNITSTEKPGCETAVKLIRGKETNTGNQLFSWECLRCRSGYNEAMQHVSVPQDYLAQFSSVQGSVIQLKRKCDWRPCGSFCDPHACVASTTFSQKFKGGHNLACKKCSAQDFGTALVNTRIDALNPSGKRVVITKVCSPEVATAAPAFDSKALMTRILTMFEGESQFTRPSDFLILVQIADAFRVLATHAFLHGTPTDEERHEKDMVGDGARFMRDEVSRAIEDFRSLHPKRVLMIARSFIDSQIIKDVRGVLDLCLATARNSMDGSDHDAKLVAAVKGCRSVDLVFALILETLCTDVLTDSQTCDIPYTEYASLWEAPQRALEILRMFGAIE